MSVSFKTRQQAREFNAKRQAKGLPGRIIDHGKEATNNGKAISRFAVTLR